MESRRLTESEGSRKYALNKRTEKILAFVLGDRYVLNYLFGAVRKNNRVNM